MSFHSGGNRETVVTLPLVTFISSMTGSQSVGRVTAFPFLVDVWEQHFCLAYCAPSNSQFALYLSAVRVTQDSTYTRLQLRLAQQCWRQRCFFCLQALLLDLDLWAYDFSVIVGLWGIVLFTYLFLTRIPSLNLCS